MRSYLSATLFALIGLLGVSGMTGCASPASQEAMQVTSIATTNKHPYSVSVRTAGGGETGAMDSTNISDADFKAAIEKSIVQSGVFKSVIEGKGSDYELSVTITQMTKPLIGLSFTVTMEAAWSLIKTSDRSVVMRKAIQSSHTASMGDAFAGVTRLRMAVEGAARENIANGLKEISSLNL
jgi:hypothetical protein